MGIRKQTSLFLKGLEFPMHFCHKPSFEAELLAPRGALERRHVGLCLLWGLGECGAYADADAHCHHLELVGGTAIRTGLLCHPKGEGRGGCL